MVREGNKLSKKRVKIEESNQRKCYDKFWCRTEHRKIRNLAWKIASGKWNSKEDVEYLVDWWMASRNWIKNEIIRVRISWGCFIK